MIVDITNPKKPVEKFHIPGPPNAAPSLGSAQTQSNRMCLGSDLPGGTLQNLGSPLTAGPAQTQLIFTNSSISTVTNRIYQIKLLPPP